ncbi:hypothetical protein Tco_1005756 [Tanacetum coccineum]|uniref:Tf2-1-like SH3-like domain-containing protein n=1 Tax=Tanacetum coccineum TaxID=301880 RepID=A0ABQ5FH07_9ASTR
MERCEVVGWFWLPKEVMEVVWFTMVVTRCFLEVQGCEEVMEVVGWLLGGDKEASKVVDHDGVRVDAWFELEVSPWKGVIRLGKRGKLNHRYIRPFKIIAKVGTVDYRLELPEKLSRVHSTFHVSNLKKCLADEPLAIPLDEIQVDDKLHFIEEPVEIMDREVKLLKQSRIPIVKVRWNSRRGPEFTWEREDQMQKKCPHLFTNYAPMAEVAP